MGVIQYLKNDRYLGPVTGASIVGGASALVHQARVEPDASPPVCAIVKVYRKNPSDEPTRELANEIVGHHMASHLGFPVPAYAGVIELTRDRWPDNPLWKELPGSPASTVAWWSSLVAEKSVKARLRLDVLETRSALFMKALERARAELAAAADMPQIVAFDEILANVDRNVGNLLGAPANRYTLIDHGRCLTGHEWKADALQPDRRCRNILRELVKWDMLPLRTKNAGVATFDKIEPIFQGAIDALERELASIMTETDKNAVIAFLTERGRRDTAAARLGLVA